ncbi:MAG: hypothetical protein AABP62_25840 [Planctomycetota bacterium]
MRRLIGISSCVICGLAVMAAATLPTSDAANRFRRSRTSVEDLAEKIDKLERALQYYGRVTAKAPDVWGQARLMQHRREFEEQMAEQLTAFEENLNAEISVSDQAFLSEAVALGAASRGQTPPTTTEITSVTSTLTPTPGTGTTTSTANTDVIIRSGPGANFTAGQARTKLTLEPEIVLDQRKRFLDHLHEIRRVNEGDDTADAPGYSLNLVRIPISVIPGDKTRENYGAEVTVTAESHVTEELLPSTFRELVINDLIDQLALPIVKVLDLSWSEHLKGEPLRAHAELLKFYIDKCRKLQKKLDHAGPATATHRQVNEVLKESGLSISKLEKDSSQAGAEGWQENHYADWKERMGGALLKARSVAVQKQQLGEELQSACALLIDVMEDRRRSEMNQSRAIIAQSIAKGITVIGVQAPRERRSRYPIPPSQIRNVFGELEFGELTVAVFSARDRFQCRDKVHLADVQGFLRNELEHAYDFLASTACPELVPPIGIEGVVVGGDLWNSPHVPTPNDIRQPNAVIAKRRNFFSCLPVNQENVSTHPSYEEHPTQHDKHAETATEALGWAILIESALLNQQLNEDLQRVSQDPNCHCVPAGQPYCFYGPNPDPAAKQAFTEYVKCRWPIHVFALDPVTQQQNVADSFSLRREMQLAIALAFKQQFVNAQSLTRYMRRIEQDVRTIALNQTAVGFGAGDDTFGWRFFPRVQTPDVEGTLTVIGRDLLMGGPNKDQGLRRRRIEPGMRECMALVVMPSFVKHVRFDVRTNWFPLVPGHLTQVFHTARTPASMEKTVEWSKLIKSMEDSVMLCVKDQHKYRDGEVERLLKRSHQLSQELPINTMYSQVPYENTLGGFEMFASGVADLAPELVGFYGAPGIEPNLPTELFLVGSNFSVHDTHLIAGNTKVKFKLLSRDVMQATIPANVRIEHRLSEPRSSDKTACCKDGDCDESHVEIRLATPYGVSSALWVPVVVGASTAQAQIRWDRESYNVTYGWTVDGTSFKSDGNIRAVAPHHFAIDVPANYWNSTTTAKLKININSTVIGDPLLGSFETTVPQTISESGGRFIIDQTDSNFANLQTKIRDVVVAKLKTSSTPPPSYTVRLSAEITLDGDAAKKFPVTNELKICIRFVPK